MEIKLHKVVEGPLQDPDTGEWSNIYLAEYNDEVTELEIEHESMDDCYKIIRMLASTIEPIILNEEEECLTSNQN